MLKKQDPKLSFKDPHLKFKITATSPRGEWVNSSPPSAAYMRQWIGSALVQIMACRLFSAKPLSKPMLSYCQLDPRKQTSVKSLSKYKTFHSWKCIWKYPLWNGGHFVQGEMSLYCRWRWLLVMSVCPCIIAFINPHNLGTHVHHWFSCDAYLTITPVTCCSWHYHAKVYVKTMSTPNAHQLIVV